jgi:hypothetical protein
MSSPTDQLAECFRSQGKWPLLPHRRRASDKVVAQTSESAVSRVSKPAGHARFRQPCRLGNRRYGRFGNLRYNQRLTLTLSLALAPAPAPCGLNEFTCDEGVSHVRLCAQSARFKQQGTAIRCMPFKQENYCTLDVCRNLWQGDCCVHRFSRFRHHITTIVGGLLRDA